MYEPGQILQALLVRELRAALAEHSVDAGQLTSDIERRVRLIGQLRRDLCSPRADLVNLDPRPPGF